MVLVLITILLLSVALEVSIDDEGDPLLFSDSLEMDEDILFFWEC